MIWYSGSDLGNIDNSLLYRIRINLWRDIYINLIAGSHIIKRYEESPLLYIIFEIYFGDESCHEEWERRDSSHDKEIQYNFREEDNLN